ncbi:MAG: hypothetical protein KatS3mg031_2943 [Chitinophagales bacterium]|nr:MAG: hypothetical protein KatS3mg031_2943 [Chitinophagales bacterium]
MATRVKTVQFGFPVLPTLANDTLTNLPQITVYIPETVVAFRSVWVEITADDIITALGGSLTTKTVNLRLNTLSYQSTTNGNTLTHSGENMSWFTARDFTSYFSTNWTGTSMTCDVQVQIRQSTGSTLGWNNVCAVLYITYEYDDTATTQIKTVEIPLDGPKTSLPTVKTSYDTIPALDTYLPENSKTYRNIFIVVEHNTNTADTTDHTISLELSSLGVHTTQIYEAALATARKSTYIWNITSYITTNTSHTFNIWASVANKSHCPQVKLVVTYEYNAGTSTTIMNSVRITAPYIGTYPNGGTYYNVVYNNLNIQEENPLMSRLAFYGNIYGVGAIGSTTSVGIGALSPVDITIANSNVIAGSMTFMVRGDSAYTLQRGFNQFVFGITTNTGTICSVHGYWILNYTSSKHSSGDGVHNKTVLYLLGGTGPLAIIASFTNRSIPIPETSAYYLNNVSLLLTCVNSGTHITSSITVAISRNTSNTNPEPVAFAPFLGDSEVGANDFYLDFTSKCRQYPQEPDTGKMIITDSLNYFILPAQGLYFFEKTVVAVTYHSISYTVNGSISGSSGGTVDIRLHTVDFQTRTFAPIGTRSINAANTSRTGDGAFSLTWYDNTNNVYITAVEGSNRALSPTQSPTSSFSITFGGGGGPTAIIGGRINIT